jgi:hypothetical protein
MSRRDRVNSYSHSSWNKLVRVRFVLDVKKNHKYTFNDNVCNQQHLFWSKLNKNRSWKVKASSWVDYTWCFHYLPLPAGTKK